MSWFFSLDLVSLFLSLAPVSPFCSREPFVSCPKFAPVYIKISTPLCLILMLLMHFSPFFTHNEKCPLTHYSYLILVQEPYATSIVVPKFPRGKESEDGKINIRNNIQKAYIRWSSLSKWEERKCSTTAANLFIHLADCCHVMPS